QNPDENRPDTDQMVIDQTIPVEHRYGRPYEESYIKSRERFFLKNIYEQNNKEFSFFSINRDIFRAFFGFKYNLEEVPIFNESRLLIAINSAPSEVLPDSGPRQNKKRKDRRRPIASPQVRPQVVKDGTRIGQSDFTFTRNKPQSRPVKIAKSKIPRLRSKVAEGTSAMLQTQSIKEDIEQLFDGDPTPADEQSSKPRATDGIQSLGKEVESPDQEMSTPIFYPSLYELWSKECGPGDLFVVDSDKGTRQHISVKDKEQVEGLIMRAATNNIFFATYSQNRNALQTIMSEDVGKAAKSSEKDGVVYLFKRGITDQSKDSLSAIGFERFKGETTKDRLGQIEARYRNKRKYSFTKEREHSFTRENRKKVRQQADITNKKLPTEATAIVQTTIEQPTQLRSASQQSEEEEL
ncbi:MAG: hypothetical protein Q9214_006321, partial [Letrouitia sp. 1 TL-2023]